MFGYGEDYTGPKFYMDKDVILVTINYRLGALGIYNKKFKKLLTACTHLLTGILALDGTIIYLGTSLKIKFCSYSFLSM